MRPHQNPRPCDKCGLPVPMGNDAVNLAILIPGNATAYLVMARPRHLLATEHCEGSPSRAQYLEGQPRDQRDQYPLNEGMVQVVREAYAALQDMAADEPAFA